MKRVMPLVAVLAGVTAIGLLAAPLHSQARPEHIYGIEHIGLNVPDAEQCVGWFCENLDMKIARKIGGPSNAHFLVDAAGKNMLEVYTNTSAPIPDYAKMDPLALHFAFKVDDVAAARQRLIDAGATPEGDVTNTEAGDHLAMLRSPQGIPIQLAKRAKPMVD